MRVNPRAVLALLGTAAMTKQSKDAKGRQKARAKEGRPPLLASSAVVLAAGGLFYLWRRGRRTSQNLLDGGRQSPGGVESTVVIEETVEVLEEPASGVTPEAASANGQEAAHGTFSDESGASNPDVDAHPGDSQVRPRSEGHPGGASDVIASPEAVVDPGATPDPIVSPEPALPRKTGDTESEKGSTESGNQGDPQSPGS